MAPGAATTSAGYSVLKAVSTRRAGTCQQALEISMAQGRPALSAAGIGYADVAEVAYPRNGLDVALQHVTEGIARCRQLTYTRPL